MNLADGVKVNALAKTKMEDGEEEADTNGEAEMEEAELQGEEV
jgi:hypothetical protein